MSIGGSGQPNIPSPTLTDVGKGRFARSRRAAVLERHDGSAWCEVGWFGTIRDAGVALDEAIGAGAAPGSMRVVEAAASTTTRFLMIAGAIVLVVAAALVLYMLFG
jgi:hypothetical protein